MYFEFSLLLLLFFVIIIVFVIIVTFCFFYFSFNYFLSLSLSLSVLVLLFWQLSFFFNHDFYCCYYCYHFHNCCFYYYYCYCDYYYFCYLWLSSSWLLSFSVSCVTNWTHRRKMFRPYCTFHALRLSTDTTKLKLRASNTKENNNKGSNSFCLWKQWIFFPQTVSIIFFWKKRGLSVTTMQFSKIKWYIGFRMAYLLDPVGKKHHGRHDFVNVGCSSKQQRLKESDAQLEICSNYKYNNTISHRLQNVSIHPHFNRSI